MEDDVKLAVEAEKIFNNSNLLLMTFVDDNISTDALKTIHNGVKNVKSLQSGFVPQTRYIIEVTDIFDVPSVITALMEHNFDGRQVEVKLLEKCNDGYFGLDPCKLEVKNLSNSISKCDLKQLFPLSTDYVFICTPETNVNLKTVIVHFANVQDAISCFKTVNLVKYNDNILSIKFFRKNVNMNTSSTAKSRFAVRNSMDYSTHDENYFDNRRIKAERNEEVNIAQANKQISDTLIVHNLPSAMEEKEIVTLFPTLYRYKLFQKTASKSCIIYFKTTSEAFTAYTNCDNIYMSRILQIDFYDKKLDGSDNGSSNTAMFSRDRSINQQRSGRIASNTNNYFSFEQSIKKEFDHPSENKEDSFTLRVKNLPVNTTKEDLRQLFPKHCKHQLKVKKTGECASALVCFLTSTAASNAYKSMQKKHFHGHVLSIHLKSKPFNLNPFAVRNVNTSNPKQSGTSNSGTTQNGIMVLKDLNGDFLTEDDVECESEESYSGDEGLEANSDIMEDDESEEDIIQGKHLFESILAVDEDLF